jgi:hypothetical protein
MSAVLEWHRKTTRYTDSELRRTHLGFTLYPERAAEFWARVEAVAAGAGSRLGAH